MECFGVLYPGRTAACKLGQRCILFCNAFNQFRSLFHDGEVSGEVGVKDVIGAQLTKQPHHLFFFKTAGFQAERFRKSDANRRRSGDHNNAVGIFNGLLNLRVLIAGQKAAGRADIDALPAVDADCLVCGLCQIIVTVHANVVFADLAAHGAIHAQGLISHQRGIVLLDCNTYIQGLMFGHRFSHCYLGLGV